MTDMPDTISGTRPEQAAGAGPRRRRRRPWRIALVSLGSLLALIVVTALGSYAYLNHVVSGIPRIYVAHLTAATSAEETFLVTAEPTGVTGAETTTRENVESNLVMLLHIDANGKGGGAVSIPGETVVNVPGKGREALWDALRQGGPSLLVETVAKVTGVPINHYARIDFQHLTSLVNTIGGVQVTLPKASTSFGYKFPAGLNQLNGVTAIYYARDPSLSDQGRLLRQVSVVRAILTKIADDHLVTNPITMVHVLNAIKSALTVDSNMTNSEIASLAKQFGTLSSSAATYVIAPTATQGGKLVLDPAVDNRLWTAIEQNSIADFAASNPSAVVPQDVP